MGCYSRVLAREGETIGVIGGCLLVYSSHGQPRHRPRIGDVWIESTFGVAGEQGNGRLVRAQPVSISGPQGAAKRLSELTGLPEERYASEDPPETTPAEASRTLSSAATIAPAEVPAMFCGS
jgi:hypothetical protein